MDGMTMDLFADEAPAAAAPVRARPDPQYDRLLELALADAGRKVALKAMDPEVRESLALAVEVVANAKKQAYERAYAGDHPGSATWPARQPALDSAIALLHASFVDINFIPMAGYAPV